MSQPRGVLHITNCTHRQRHEDLYSRATVTLRLCDGKWRVWRAGRASIGCELEHSKEVVVPVWMGTGALVEAKQSRADGRLTGGTKAATARYLGDFINLSGTNSTIIQKESCDPETSASRASRFFSKTWYSAPCCQDSRFASSPEARWTNCKHTLIHWLDERWAGEVGVL